MTGLQYSTNEHRFFSTMSVFLFVVITLGFANTYGARIFLNNESVPSIIHIHALIFCSWLILFVIQCFFILRKKIALHKKMGALGMILAGVMLFSGIITGVSAAKMGHLGIPGVEFPTAEGFLLLNISSACIFAILAFAGWIYRHDPQTHKRLMLMATVAGLAPPGISRLPLLSGHTPAIAAFTFFVVAIGPLYDWKQSGRPHRAYYYSLPLVLFILPQVVLSLSATMLWTSIAKLLMNVI